MGQRCKDFNYDYRGFKVMVAEDRHMIVRNKEYFYAAADENEAEWWIDMYMIAGDEYMTLNESPHTIKL